MDRALFIDFDGTLVEIAETPEAVRVDAALSAMLARLRDGLGGALAIVSGRSLQALDGFLAPERFDAAGLHGLERRAAGIVQPCRPADHPELRARVERLRAEAPAGLLLEDKGCSAALHWRLTPHLATEAVRLMTEAAAALGPAYRLQEGKAVLEILPASAGKGGAIRTFLRTAPYLGRQPIFIGDDRTDEDGFAAVEEAGGVSVKIGPGKTLARRRLAGPADLRVRLAAWARGGVDLADLPVV